MTQSTESPGYSVPARAIPRWSPNRWLPHVPTAPQLAFLSLTEREALYGGAAGGGKSDALLMDALAWIDHPDYAGLLVRRTYRDLALSGAIMDRARTWLGPFVARGEIHWDSIDHRFTFPSGARLQFGYLASPADRYRYQCFHPDTELLAESGWTPVAEVQVGDMAATLDPATREMTYEPVTRTWTYPFDGDLVTLYQRQGSAFAVTPNHTLWASTDRLPGELRPFRADGLPFTARVPQAAGSWVGEEPPPFVEFASPGHNGRTIRFSVADWMSLLGWYLAEGSCDDVPRWAIRLSQVNERGRGIIRDLLTRLGVNFHESPREFSFNNRALVEYLRPLGTSNVKRIPPEVKHYPSRLLLPLLVALVEGDGTWRGSDRLGHFVSSSKALADDVCEIAVKCGYRPTICERQGNPPESPYGTKSRFHVSLMHRTADTRVDGPTGRMRYQGPVHCVSVPPHHTVLTRYRGRVSWSGQSAEYQYIGMDEATQFEEADYVYLLSRNRRTVTSTVPGLKARLGTNPGGIGHDWVRRRFLPWTDDATGSVVYPHREDGQRRIFIPARLWDNPHVNAEEYAANLRELDPVLVAQLLNGDWGVRPPGEMFDRRWFDLDGAEHIGRVRSWVRAWDFAGTRKRAVGHDPDWTVGTLMGWTDAGDIVVLSVIRKRDTAGAIEELVLQTARMDKTYPGCSMVRVEQEPGSSGKFVTESYSRKLLGYNFEGIPATGPKSARAVPFAQAAKAGRVHLVDAPWVGDWLSEIEAFPQDSLHDDQVDSASLAFQMLTNTPSPAGATLGGGHQTRGSSPYDAPRHVIGSR